MILDRLENAVMFRPLGRQIAAALDYLTTTDFRALPAGRYELDGAKLYAMVQRYTAKPAAGARWEAHRRYLDVQYVAEGAERIGWAPLTQEVAVETPYDAEKDVAFYRAAGDLLTIAQGTFAIFAPHDIHSPGLYLPPGKAADVLKVVVKVAWPLEA